MNINEIINILWNNADKDFDYNLLYQNKLKKKNNEDKSEEKLFEYFDETKLCKYRDFINLLDNYELKLGIR